MDSRASAYSSFAKQSDGITETIIALSPDLVEAVMTGKEKATIRKGRRNYPLGRAVFDAKTTKIPIEITALDIKQYKDLSDEDGQLDGSVSKEELKASLRIYYPDIQDTNEVTIVHFKLAR